MMIFLCGGARKLKKSTKRVVFAFQKFYSFLSVYVFLKPGSPPKRGRAHTRAHTKRELLYSSFRCFWAHRFCGSLSVCLESVLLSADNEWILNP